MLRLITCLIILFQLFSCEKEIFIEQKLIGEWTLVSNAIPNNNTFAVQKDETLGLKMDIKENDIIRFSDDYEMNEFKIIDIKKESKQIQLISYDGNFISNFVFTISLKRKKGGKFFFKYYTNESDTIIGTYWVPNQPFITNDCPNISSAPLANGSFQYSEIFGVYIK